MRITFRRRDDGVVYATVECAPPGGELPRDQRRWFARAELLAGLVEAVAALGSPSDEEIRRTVRSKLSSVLLNEPGADLADVADLPSPGALAAAARALQIEASRWARLRAGEELVYEWTPPSPRPSAR